MFMYNGSVHDVRNLLKSKTKYNRWINGEINEANKLLNKTPENREIAMMDSVNARTISKEYVCARTISKEYVAAESW